LLKARKEREEIMKRTACKEGRSFKMQITNLSVETLLLLLIIPFLFTGCISTNLAVKSDNPVSFKEREKKLPLSVGFYISNETKKHFIKADGPMGSSYNFLIGEALETNAIESLRKIFPVVSVISNKTNIPSDIERIINIEILPTSNFILGATHFSEQKSKVELGCEIYDSKWNLLWKESSIGQVNRSTGSLIGKSIQERALGDIVNETLALSLEQLNDKIIMSGENAILKIGNK
jgi:hypothetical protein